MNEGDDLELVRGRSGRVWVVVGALVLLMAAGGGALAYFAMQPDPDPVRVAVVVRGGVGPAFDAPFRRAFAGQLEEHGFDVATDEVTLTGADIDAAVAEARARALSIEAANTLILDVSVEATREAAVAGKQVYRSRLSVHVVPTLPGEVLHDALEFTSVGSSPPLIAARLQDTWVDVLGPSAIDLLYQTEPVARVVGGEDLGMDRMRFVTELRERKTMVEERRERVQAWDDFVARGLEEVAHLTDAEPGVTCVGDPSRPWSLIGLSPDGSKAIVQEHYRTPIQEMLITGLRWTEPPEALLVVDLAGDAEPTTLLRSSHFYGLASANSEGRYATAALFSGDVPTVVSLDAESGAWKQRWLLSGDERVGYRNTSADGALIFGHRREGGWTLFDGEQAVVMPDFRRARLLELPGAGPRVVGQLEDGELTIMAPDGAKDGASTALPGRLRAVLGVQSDALALLVRDEAGCATRSWSLASRELGEPVRLPLCMDDVQMLPDGRLVGVGMRSATGDPPGDSEIVLVQPGSTEVTVLTRGTSRDELLRVSADGRRVAFNRRVGEWPREYDVELYRRVVCWADVPAAP